MLKHTNSVKRHNIRGVQTVRKYRFNILLCSGCRKLNINGVWKVPTGSVNKDISDLCRKNNLISTYRVAECCDYPDCKTVVGDNEEEDDDDQNILIVKKIIKVFQNLRQIFKKIRKK